MPSVKPARRIMPVAGHMGWKLVPDRYDDGGISGGTLDRPALQRIARTNTRPVAIDVVVVYKIDRLTRSLDRLRQDRRSVR